jgi:hypothetical protein
VWEGSSRAWGHAWPQVIAPRALKGKQTGDMNAASQRVMRLFFSDPQFHSILPHPLMLSKTTVASDVRCMLLLMISNDRISTSFVQVQVQARISIPPRAETTGIANQTQTQTQKNNLKQCKSKTPITVQDTSPPTQTITSPKP